MAQDRLQEIRQNRLRKRADLIQRGEVPYPAEAKRTHTVMAALADFDKLNHDQTPITLAGRLTALRRHGQLAFADLADASGSIQLQVSESAVPADIFARLNDIDIGDFIEAAGTLTRTQRGTPTLQIKEFHLLSKSLRPLPSNWFGLKDPETRFREREVDLLINKQAREAVRLRGALTNWLRQKYTEAGYLEVETPMLQPIAGGTTATPFQTHHEALNTDLFLRVAPELYLKRLVVGGFEKVFEIGRNFRNEGVDREHNPEFTMLEAYWAYADYEDLMEFCEELLNGCVRYFRDSEDLPHHGDVISWTRPFERVRFVDAVSEAIGFDILAEKDLKIYEKKFRELNLPVPAVKTYAKFVDEFYKETIRPKLARPTILYDFPVEIEPLAKQNATDPRIVERFQLVVVGTELLKAYSELNDPVVQHQRFEEQQAAREAGDKEISEVDNDYVRALEYGMPPAAGVGLGIDRLLWLLTDAPALRDVMAFPLLKQRT